MIRALMLALALTIPAAHASAQLPQPEPAAPQTPAEPPAPVEPAPPVEPPPAPDDFGRNTEQVVRVGSDYTLAAGDEVGEAVVVMGNAIIDGRVDGDLVVVLGEARLGPAAVVDGDLVVVGGSLVVQPGAAARRDLVVVGGGLDAPADFMAGGEQVVFGFRAVGDRVRGLLPWLLRGLLWGRPIVPDLPWVWVVVLSVFLIYLVLLLLFDHPVRAAADTLSLTPLKALATGLVVLLVLGPIILLLAATVVGLLVVPVALCAVFVAGLVGRIAVARWLGSRLVSEGDDESRFLLARSFAVGSALLILLYMVPILGGVVWALAGAAGLGAATLAFVSAYRKENPPPPAPAAPLVPPPPPLSPPQSPDALPGPAAALAESALFPRASFADRLAAFVLDALLVAVTIGLLEPLDDDMFVPLFLAYRFAFWTWKGTTVGGIICQLRLTRLDGTRAGPAEALVRSLASIFSIALLGIGCLWMLRDPEQQTWHDKIAGTFVVKVPRNWPL
jgi:uncharacterized RDD family membrane protein YckC